MPALFALHLQQNPTYISIVNLQPNYLCHNFVFFKKNQKKKKIKKRKTKSMIEVLVIALLLINSVLICNVNTQNYTHFGYQFLINETNCYQFWHEFNTTTQHGIWKNLNVLTFSFLFLFFLFFNFLFLFFKVIICCSQLQNALSKKFENKNKNKIKQKTCHIVRIPIVTVLQTKIRHK